MSSLVMIVLVYYFELLCLCRLFLSLVLRISLLVSLLFRSLYLLLGNVLLFSLLFSLLFGSLSLLLRILQDEVIGVSINKVELLAEELAASCRYMMSCSWSQSSKV